MRGASEGVVDVGGAVVVVVAKRRYDCEVESGDVSVIVAEMVEGNLCAATEEAGLKKESLLVRSVAGVEAEIDVNERRALSGVCVFEKVVVRRIIDA